MEGEGDSEEQPISALCSDFDDFAQSFRAKLSSQSKIFSSEIDRLKRELQQTLEERDAARHENHALMLSLPLLRPDITEAENSCHVKADPTTQFSIFQVEDDPLVSENRPSFATDASYHTDCTIKYQTLQKKYRRMSQQAASYRRSFAIVKDKLSSYKSYIKDNQAEWDRNFVLRVPARKVSTEHGGLEDGIYETNAGFTTSPIPPRVWRDPLYTHTSTFAHQSSKTANEEHCSRDSDCYNRFDSIERSVNPGEASSHFVHPDVAKSESTGRSAESWKSDLDKNVKFGATPLLNISLEVSTEAKLPDDAAEDNEAGLQETPVLNACRPLKRRRGGDHGQDSHPPFNRAPDYSSDGSPVKPHRIKHEDSGSPTGFLSLSAFETDYDCLDLDEVTGAIETPRKQRHPEATGEPYYALEMEQFSKAAKLRPLEPTTVGSNALKNFDSEVGNSSKTLVSPTVKESPESEADAVLSSKSKRIGDGQMTREESTFNFKQCIEAASILRPIDVNAKILPNTNVSKLEHQKRRADECSLTDNISQERDRLDSSSMRDNTHYYSEQAQKDPRVTTERLILSSRNNIDHQSPHERESVKSRGSTSKQVGSLSGLESEDEDSLKQVTLCSPHALGSCNLQLLRGNTRKLRSSPRARGRPPLQQCRLDQLRLGDFVINPARSDGTRYALAETARDVKHKRCLPNCTRAECCGDKFARLIQIGGPLQPVSSLWNSSPRDDHVRIEHDQLRTLRTSEHIEKAHPIEWQKLMHQAHVQHVLRSIGKQKHSAHRRASSPELFWDTDMPSTQKQQHFNQMAEKTERTKLEYLRLEAMKPNGLWKFRGE